VSGRPDGRSIAAMAQVSRALALAHLDRAYVLLTETFGSPAVAAAFLLENGIAATDLPRAAKRAVLASRSQPA